MQLEKPQWLKKKINWREQRSLKKGLRHLGLATVCEEASCPNQSECFSKGVATIMIMGDVCTRSCRFCNVKTGKPLPLDPEEPYRVAELVKQQGYKHVVITSVDRDDLKDDLGAGHFAKTIEAIRELCETTIEVLTPDFQGRTTCLDQVCQEDILVFNHNLETIRRLTSHIRSAAKYDRSLKVLQYVHQHYPRIHTKSGLMLGLGETEDEVIEAMQDLVEHGCQFLTIGQYLQPSNEHYPVQEYIHPDQFDVYREKGESMGFKTVFAGPFVRSSYMAGELVVRS